MQILVKVNRHGIKSKLMQFDPFFFAHLFLQVNPQLFSSREKEQMRELISTMLAYNLSYRQDRTPEGQYTYMLEP